MIYTALYVPDVLKTDPSRVQVLAVASSMDDITKAIIRLEGGKQIVKRVYYSSWQYDERTADVAFTDKAPYGPRFKYRIQRWRTR